MARLHREDGSALKPTGGKTQNSPAVVAGKHFRPLRCRSFIFEGVNDDVRAQDAPELDGGVSLLGPVEIRQLAEELGVNPTKKLGQNFVHDPNTVRKILHAADVGPQDHVIEVGPGLGSLTLALLGAVGEVTAIEIDPLLAGRLPRTVAEHAAPVAEHAAPVAAKLHLILRDALKVTAADWAEQGLAAPTALVANLPYNVSVPVLLHLLEQFPTISRVLVMVQLEVADRLAAKPGSKVYGVPSVKARYFGDTFRAATIGKNVFWPAPKVDSGLVRIDRWGVGDKPAAPWAEAVASSGFAEEVVRGETFALADAAFLQRRKTLRAALSGHFGGGQQAEDVLRAAGIDPKQRGEKLGAEEFLALALASLARKEGEQ